VASLANAPLVIPRRRVIRVGGQAVAERETIAIEIEKQILSDVRHLLKEITIEEVIQQDRLGNESTRLAVDNKETKPLKYAQRKTEVDFGNFIDMLVIRTIERELRSAIRRTTQKRTGKLQDLNNWEWVIFKKKGSRGKVITPNGKTLLEQGTKLVLRPTSRIAYVSWANYWVAQGGQSFTPTRGKNKGITRTINQGFMAQSIGKLKRNRLFKKYTIWISFSKKYQVTGDTYPFGSPAIILYAKRKARTYRIIR